VELIIKSIPDEIEVHVGKNIHGLEIVLHKGPAVSGRVFGPDGVTPIKGAAISLDEWFRGRKEKVYTDEDGKYTARGLVEGERMISAKKGGYAIESAIVNLQAGKMVGNVNFILGTGKISVKGKVTSADTNQGLKNAYISFIYTLIGPKLSDGFAETDEDGNYSLIGLLEPGKFKVTIILEEYESLRTEVELKIGENILDFKLAPKLTEKKTKKIGMKSRGASSNTQNCHNCEIDEDELGKGLEDACKNLSTNSEYTKCIKDPGTLNCMRNRCQRKNYVVVCTNENCETDSDESRNNTSSYVKPEFVNMDENTEGRVYVCINNNKNSDAKQFEQILIHELFHLCDKQATEESAYVRGFCSDWRNYQMMFCIYNNSYYEKKADEKENDCIRLKKNKTTSFQSSCA
jgi:hypothetical protein